MNISTAGFNLACGIIGLLIIWFGTHSIVGLLGGLIAGIHVNYRPN